MKHVDNDSLPLVSVVTVFYNRSPLVKDSIDSLVSQSYRNIEIIIVDDGSTDDTLEKLKVYEHNNRVKLISHENIGFVRAIKNAILHASGEYIAIHGSGDISHTERIEIQVKEFLSDKSVGVVGCRSLFKVRNTNISYVNGKAGKGDFSKKLLSANCFHHGEVMFKKDIYDKVGGYREFFKYAQDMDLWCRMSTLANFSLLSNILYTRFVNQPGSVSSDPHKTRLQRYLGKFACYCHAKRLEIGVDPLDSEGIYSIFYFNNSKIKYSMLAQSIRMCISKDKKSSVLFAQWSSEEGLILANIFLFLYKNMFGLTSFLTSLLWRYSRKRAR